jgi:putative PIN family toxin of toxin-antitoxin system
VAKPLVVLDTNVFVSGLISPGGVPGAILRRFRGGDFEIATSKTQVREINAVLKRPSLMRALPKGTSREVLAFLFGFKRLTKIYDLRSSLGTSETVTTTRVCLKMWGSAPNQRPRNPRA